MTPFGVISGRRIGHRADCEFRPLPNRRLASGIWLASTVGEFAPSAVTLASCSFGTMRLSLNRLSTGMSLPPILCSARSHIHHPSLTALSTLALGWLIPQGGRPPPPCHRHPPAPTPPLDRKTPLRRDPRIRPSSLQSLAEVTTTVLTPSFSPASPRSRPRPLSP
jgi:hypothetical protein